jgi:hypothetical protein
MAKQAPRPQQRPQQPAAPQRAKATPPPAPRRSAESALTRDNRNFIFGTRNLLIMGAGTLMVILGLALMAGGGMPDPNTWDPNVIYSPRRITLAPLMMVAGFVVLVWGIFSKSPAAKQTDIAAPVPADKPAGEEA